MEYDYYIYVYQFCVYYNGITKCQTYEIKLIGAHQLMMKVKLMWYDCQASYIHTQRDLLLACQGQNLIFQYEGVLVEHKITDGLRANNCL